MMNENDYLEQVNDLKKQYDEKQSEILRGERMIDFLKEEIVKIYGTIKMLSSAVRNEALSINILMNYLELIENRTEYFVPLSYYRRYPVGRTLSGG